MKHALTQYRDENGMTLEAFAARVASNKSQVWKWENGSIPRPPQMQRIREVTGGAIDANAWYIEGAAQ